MLVCLGSGCGRRIGPVHLVLVAVGVLERAGKSAYLGKGALAGYRGRDLLGSYVLDGSNGVVLRVDDADYLALGVGQGLDIGEAEVALELLSELLDCRRSVFFGAEVERLLDEVDAGLFDDESQGALAVVVVCLYLRGLNISCGEAARPALAGYGEDCGQVVAVLCLGVSALFKSFLRAVEDELLERGNGLFEQVERPASVVKELVENAMDAGATAITVEIRDGGISLVRITDNGSGIPAEQVPLAFLRHATSKIRSVEELVQIASLGFRGEALSSISAVAQVEMITKTPDALTGTRYVIEGGAEKANEEVGAPTGTTFLVRNLFYNTPARQKFLKTPVTEANAVTSVVEQLALSHPGISFKYMVNSQVKLHTSGNRNLKELVYNIYGRDIARELIEIHSESPLMTIDGFIGKPVISRGNRNFENYYVNGRYVRSKLLARAIEDGYQTSMMQHKYPFTLFYVQMDGEAVDVNVHPTKMELRFSHQEEIYRQMRDMISDALNHREQIVKVSLSSDRERKAEEKAARKEQIVVPEPFEQKRQVKEGFARQSLPVEPVSSQSRRMPIFPEVERNGYRAAKTYVPVQQMTGMTREEEELFEPGAGNVSKTADLSNADAIQHQQEPDAAPTVSSMPEESSSASASPEPEGQMQLFDEQFLTPEAEKSHRIIGQVFDTYWLIQYGENLYIIDQHAAHEKVLFERMMKNYREKNVTSQMVSPPLIVSLTPQEADLVTRYMDVFQSFGYEISPFGGKDYAINAVPHNLYGIATEELFIEILDNLEEVREKPLEILKDRLATMSCKAAVKGNNHLSYAEAEQLIAELLTLEDPYHCPHGRPTIISLSKRELEKKFKRIV